MPPTISTKRAYTMRLDGASPDDPSWRERLWITHEKVNAGARAFGDLLLTLRGGVAPEDASEKAQRRLLALCWFSVESDIPETTEFRVPSVDSPKGRRADEDGMRKALSRCLAAKGITEPDRSAWESDCLPALQARIREDAVWVERWRKFEKMEEKPTPGEVRSILAALLGKDFLKTRGKRTKKGAETGAEESAAMRDEKAEGRVVKAARSLYGQWFGEGKKADFEAVARSYGQLAEFAEEVARQPSPNAARLKARILNFRKTNEWPPLEPKTKGRGNSKIVVAIAEPAISKSGRSNAARPAWERVLLGLRADSSDAPPPSLPAELLAKDFWEKLARDAQSAQKSGLGKKGEAKGKWQAELQKRLQEKLAITFGDKSGGKANTEFCRLMLAEAAKRLSQTHSWARRKELERLDSEEWLEQKGARFKPGGDDAEAAERLEAYLDEVESGSGALSRPVISKNALDGWPELVKNWKSCADAEARKTAVRELQAAVEKFGDARLFLALAEDDALCVWKRGGKADKDILLDYAGWTRAQEAVRRHKVPSFRHPDALRHPVFCEFGNSRPEVRYGWQEKSKKSRKAATAEVSVSQQRAIDLLLLDERGRASDVRLRWRSSRLAFELGLGDGESMEKDGLSRNTRLGRQAADGLPRGRLDRATPAGVRNGKKEMNARLQADREALAALARLDDTDPARAKKLRSRLGWFVTFSPELIPSGPWLDFVKSPAVGKIVASRNGDSPVWFASREKRWLDRRDKGWLVRPGLGALPGVRVLGVDLGHRYGAIGAVWQQVSVKAVREAARLARVPEPSEQAVSFRCPDPTRPKNKSGKNKDALPELLFRRVGPDEWARLERQFVVRLPGEVKGDTRPLTKWEKDWLADFLRPMGSEPEDILKLDVCEARLEALHIATAALRRHGDRARIAHYLGAEKLPGPGGDLHSVSTHEQRVPHAKKALQLWDSLAGRSDGRERELWQQHVEPLKPDLSHTEGEQDRAKAKQREALRDRVAEGLAGNAAASQKIAEAFAELWEGEDALWRERLRCLSAWIVRGRRRAEDGRWVRDERSQAGAGGLSLERISALERLARLQRAFAHRPTPEKLHDDSAETVRHGRAVRRKMELLREDRLKKLANAVAMAAMGLVAAGDDKTRRVEQARHDGPRFAPVHAVAIENLERYRPEVSRTRRENRGLMSWSAQELAKRLGDACELHGLLLLQVMPNYTSRLCSRCGAWGLRGEWVPPDRITQDRYWSRQLEKARAAKPNERTPLQARLIELADGPNGQKQIAVPLPRSGGPIFFCSNKTCASKGGLQADLNAAANVGLRAMLDGRWERAWAYLPTRAGKPTGEGALKGMPEVFKKIVLPSDGAKKDDKIVNLFRDASNPADLKLSDWKPFKEFFREVEDRVLARGEGPTQVARKD